MYMIKFLHTGAQLHNSVDYQILPTTKQPATWLRYRQLSFVNLHAVLVSETDTFSSYFVLFVICLLVFSLHAAAWIPHSLHLRLDLPIGILALKI